MTQGNARLFTWLILWLVIPLVTAMGTFYLSMDKTFSQAIAEERINIRSRIVSLVGYSLHEATGEFDDQAYYYFNDIDNTKFKVLVRWGNGGRRLFPAVGSLYRIKGKVYIAEEPYLYCTEIEAIDSTDWQFRIDTFMKSIKH